MVRQSRVDQFIDVLGDQFEKLPKIPVNLQKAIVSVLPYLALIFGILGISLTVVALGIFTVLDPVSQITGGKDTGENFFFVLLSLISSLILLSSFSGLHRKKVVGWKRIYLSQALALLSNIFLLDVLGVILYFFRFYLLYSIREFYSTEKS